jgi:hypothetical protein
MSAPMMYRWDGEAMQLLPYFQKQADKVFTIGETYRLSEVESRSMRSHRHFFACINEAWNNLDEEDTDRFPSPDHLRKWALTYTPFCTVRQYDAASNAEAIRLRHFLRSGDDFVRVEVDGKTVREFKPHSQAVAAMPNNKTFQASKDAVLDILARKLGITTDALEEAGRRAA